MRSRFFAILATAALFTSAASFAQWWDPTDMTPPYLKGTPQAPKVVYDFAKKRAAGHAINAAIWNSDFAKVERMYDEFLSQKLRAADGTWMVQVVQDTLDGLFQAAGEAQMTKVMEAWQRAVPDSKLRPVIEADRWQRFAWNARGGSTPSTEAMQVFRERLAKAAQALEASAEVGKDSPIWYWVALIVAGSSGRPAAQFDALFDEATARFPSYQPLYYTRVNYMLPQWGGDYRQVEAFATRAAAKTVAQEGESLYAWIYADVAIKQVRYNGADFFAEAGVSWPRLKSSFEDLVRRYPDPGNKSRFLAFACKVRDRDTTARLLQELGTRAEIGMTFDGVTLESCRRFAFQPV